MPDKTFHLSPDYEYPLKKLVTAAGYTNPQEGYQALAEAIKDSGSIYPEVILERFIKKAKESGKFEGAPEGYARAIQEILRGGIFNDAGLDAYAKPCAALILGLGEIAAQAYENDSQTRFILASADISNLGGLNLAERNRRKADILLQHLAQKPGLLMDQWAHEKGYEISSLMIRTGGDEFKSIYRIRRKDGGAIDNHLLETQLREAAGEMNQKLHHFSNYDLGMIDIDHTKAGRKPGVTNTIALRAPNPGHPNIARELQEMEADIAAARRNQESGEQAAPTTRVGGKLHHTKPPSRHKVDVADPYKDISLAPGQYESLEQYSLRMALAKAGFSSLAASPDLFSYDKERRRARINQQHGLFAPLSPEQKSLVFRVLEAEELRGVIDPVSRCMSAAYLDQCRALHHAQCNMRGEQPEEYEVELKNLGGMNRLGESLGDAVLREVGKICESAYLSAFSHSDAPLQKPAIAQQGGGLFRTFIPPGATKEQIQKFETSIKKEIEQLNQMSLRDFVDARRVRLSEEIHSDTTRIAEIQNPKKPTGKEGVRHGVTVEIRKGEPHEQEKWQRRVGDNPAAATTQSLRG
ncbi:MAG: hypothetical protein ACK52W_03335 [Alphaproteobacteria bacterium]